MSKSNVSNLSPKYNCIFAGLVYKISFWILLSFNSDNIPKSVPNFTFEINKLVQALGGKDNILDYEDNMSRLKVTLKDISLVDKDGIQRLGAKGIVEIDNQLKIIFGPNAKTLKKYISEMK